MTTAYGLPAVEVVQPDGEVVAYVVRPAIPLPGEAAAWAVTGPDGQAYRVGRRPGPDGWRCSCPDFRFRFRRHRARDPGALCKHGEAVRAARGHAGG